MKKGLEGGSAQPACTATILAVGLRNAGRIDEAEAELRRVLELDENFPMAVGTLGAVCAQQGRFEEALALSEKAYALDAVVQSGRGTTRGAPGSHRSHEPRRDAARRAQTGHGMGSPGRAGRVSCDVRRIRSGGRMGRTSDRKPVSGTHPDPQTAHGAEPGVAGPGEDDELTGSCVEPPLPDAIYFFQVASGICFRRGRHCCPKSVSTRADVFGTDR